MGALAPTFDELGAIIGMPLPTAMRIETGAWNGDHHGYVRAWQAAGWRARLDRRNQRVLFTIVAEE